MTFTNLAEEIKKGCTNFGNTLYIKQGYQRCGQKDLNEFNKNKIWYCLDCKAKAQTLKEAGKDFLEFLKHQAYSTADDYVDCNKCGCNEMNSEEKIEDIQNGLKILEDVK
jgi:hypothetical protein